MRTNSCTICDLRGANLQGANLQGAYLEETNLRGANLRGANLQDAYLTDANLQGADLKGARLDSRTRAIARETGAINIPGITSSIVGAKKAPRVQPKLPAAITPNQKAGMAAYRRGDWITALKHLRPLAEQGDSIAQYAIGSMYEDGRGVPFQGRSSGRHALILARRR